MLNEKKLARAMIEEWKAGGYIAGRFDMEGDDMLMLISPVWQLACPTQELPRRCLGLIVEHCGELPKESAMRCMKGGEQVTMLDMVKGVYGDLLEMREDAEGCMMRTGVTIGGLRIWQDADTWTLRLMDQALTDICDLSEGDSDAEMVKGGILFTDSTSTLLVKKEDPEDWKHVLDALKKVRI